MNEVIEWLNGYYGKLTIVLVNQNRLIDNGVGGWTDDSPGSYSDNLSNTEGEAVGVHVEYAYLANNPAFNVTTSVLYSSDATPVSAAVLTGSPAEPHSNIADYTFTVGFANAKDSSSNQPYYLRIVDSMEAEILHKGNAGDYETVRTVELPVGSSTKLTFLKADSTESGWYKVVYRYTVNGKTTETVVAEDIYLDNTCSIEPSVRTYTRTFDLYVRQPEWRYGTYYVGYTKYTHASSAAANDNIQDGDIVKIGVAPIQVPEDKLPDGSRFYSTREDFPTAEYAAINDKSQYADRFYLKDKDQNILTFNFAETLSTAGTADISRIGGEKYFYAWSGNDPNGEANARAAKQTFTPDQTITLTVTDGGVGGFAAAELQEGQVRLFPPMGNLGERGGYHRRHHHDVSESGHGGQAHRSQLQTA